MTAYLDHAATTPLLPVARQAWLDASELHGNPSSLHASGRAARAHLENSRDVIGQAVGANAHEVVFTSGGTEADNLAVIGLYRARRTDARRRILISAVEHHAVSEPAQWLAANEQAELEELPVDGTGVVDLERAQQSIDRDPGSVALISVMGANNEVGAVQPVSEIVRMATVHGIPVHSDAVQGLGWLDFDFAASGLAAATITGHKIGGPVGTGALLVQRGVGLVPVSHGGGQERQIRSGTLDVAGVAGFAAAAAHVKEHRAQDRSRVQALRDRLANGVVEAVPGARLSGPTLDGPRVASIAHFTFDGCEGDSLLYLLDAQGVECSTGSACSAGVPQASHVLTAMGIDSRGALRFSLGVSSTELDVDHLLEAIGGVVDRARNAGLASAARSR